MKRLNKHSFHSFESCVTTLTDFGPPVIAILKGTNMIRDHVIGIWQNQIIDYESEYTYPLTMNNLNYACGDESSFSGLDRPIALFPPKSIKKQHQTENEAKYDWISIDHKSVKDISE